MSVSSCSSVKMLSNLSVCSGEIEYCFSAIGSRRFRGSYTRYSTVGLAFAMSLITTIHREPRDASIDCSSPSM